MPIKRRHESGALVFDKTPEELEMDSVKERLAVVEEELKKSKASNKKTTSKSKEVEE